MGGAATGRDGSVVNGHSRGRDDTRWAKLERELAAERDMSGWLLEHYEPQLAASADLNARYDGRWHVWFVAQGTSTVEWLARPAGNGEPLLSAATPEELVQLIDQQQ